MIKKRQVCSKNGSLNYFMSRSKIEQHNPQSATPSSLLQMMDLYPPGSSSRCTCLDFELSFFPLPKCSFQYVLPSIFVSVIWLYVSILFRDLTCSYCHLIQVIFIILKLQPIVMFSIVKAMIK